MVTIISFGTANWTKLEHMYLSWNMYRTFVVPRFFTWNRLDGRRVSICICVLVCDQTSHETYAVDPAKGALQVDIPKAIPRVRMSAHLARLAPASAHTR